MLLHHVCDFLIRALFCQARLWMGVTNNSTVESDFRWQDGLPVQMPQTNWAPNQPMKLPKANGRCVIVDKSGQWYARHCKMRRKFLCQKFAGSLRGAR